MFCPNCNVSRQAMAAFLARAANLDTSNPPATPTFADVPRDHMFYGAIEAISAAGITNGCGDGRNFCPGNELTRGQAAVMIHRARGWSDETPAGAPTFDDVPADHRFSAAIETINQRCVTNGCGDGSNFCPDDVIVRAHVAAFIARAFNLEGNNSCAADPTPAVEPDPQPQPQPEPEAEVDDKPVVSGSGDSDMTAQVQSSGGGCSSTSSSPAQSPMMVFAMVAFGLVALRRKRL